MSQCLNRMTKMMTMMMSCENAPDYYFMSGGMLLLFDQHSTQHMFNVT